MAIGTVGRELLGYVVGISCRDIVIGMAAGACIGCIVVISMVACRAVVGHGSVSSCQWVEVIM